MGSSTSVCPTPVYQGSSVVPVYAMEQAIMFHFLIAIPNLACAPAAKNVGGSVPEFWKASTVDHHDRSTYHDSHFRNGFS